MTQRFGRNKRRAAREAIANAQASAAMANELARWHAERTRRAEDLLGEIAERLTRAVGAKTALLPTELQPVRKGVRERWARKEQIPRDLDGFIAMSTEVPSLDINIRDDVISLLRLIVEVERHPREFRRMIRFVDSDEADHPKFSSRATWVSEDALRSVGLMGDDIMRIAMDIARRLVELPPERSHR